jgi:SAM-dependent methyltransferase
VAILGVAGGNGLEHIDLIATERVVGVDIHSEYLDAVRVRFPQHPLVLHCADLASEAIAADPVDLVHAALVLEHAGVEGCLRNALALVKPGGWLSVVLQLPSEAAGVSQTPFVSMQSLRNHFQLVEREQLVSALQASGLQLAHEQRTDLPGGKAFWLGMFSRG